MLKPSKRSSKSGQDCLAIVETTIGSPEEARRLARALVEEKLAACVQISQITSHYMWQEREQEETEYRLRLKTRASLWPRIEDFIRQAHPYDVPQLIFYELSGASADYQAWVFEETS
jgi:periplasmic divalent cation tolerance protein